MKYHLLSTFRTHFNLKDEEVNASPTSYAEFWSQTADYISNKETKFGAIEFLHNTKNQPVQLSRFRSIDTDSLKRPLHVIELKIPAEDEVLKKIWDHINEKFSDYEFIKSKISLIFNSISVKIYNNSVALLQGDLDISNFIKQQPENQIARQLDVLQEFGVTLGEMLSQALYREYIEDLIKEIANGIPGAERFIAVDQLEYNAAFNNAILTDDSTKEKQAIRVNWVTRALLAEPDDKTDLDPIINHWLKDCGDKSLIKGVRENDDAYAIRWLNHFIRENAYEWKKDDDGNIVYNQPFSDEWQALLNAQYYYAAFEALNDSLHSTLSQAYRDINKRGSKNISALRELNRALEQDIITANLAILEYHNNYGYYKRQVAMTMKDIMAGWDFEKAILDQVKHKTFLCEQRINELHQKATSRSGFYSDILLLGIAVTSVVAFLFQVIEYGRSMSHDADLAVYESNTWNVVEFISERPTDFILTLSLALIIVLFALYSWFRRFKVMD